MINKKQVVPERLPPDAKITLAQQKRFYSKLVYRAICDIVNYRDSERPKFVDFYKSAYEWMYHGVETEELEDKEMWKLMKSFDDALSFETACSVLCWDPEWVREKVATLTRKDLERIGRNGLI